MSLDWRDVAVFFRYEMLAALRERSIVINTILIPVFMYPLLLWAMFTAITYVVGQTEGLTSRIVFQDQTGQHQALRTLIAKQENAEIRDARANVEEETPKIRAGDVDIALRLTPVPPGPKSPPGNFAAELLFDNSKDRSVQARDRVEEAVNAYRLQWLEREAARLQVSGPEWQKFMVQRKNLATGRDMGRFLLSTMLPLFLVIMVAVGCFYPAVDTTAGERERSTWETSMSTAASRSSILTAKYLYVATMGSIAGLINLAAMVLSARPVLAPLARQMGEELDFRFPLAVLPVIAAGTVLLALFVAAVMMLLASFARTFREGQSMITPFYMAIIVPVVFVRPEQAFTPAIALIPIVNVTKLFASSVVGQINWATASITLASEVVCIVLALRLASFVVSFEDVLIGSYSGNLGRFFKERLLKRKSKSAPGVGERNE